MLPSPVSQSLPLFSPGPGLPQSRPADYPGPGLDLSQALPPPQTGQGGPARAHLLLGRLTVTICLLCHKDTAQGFWGFGTKGKVSFDSTQQKSGLLQTF